MTPEEKFDSRVGWDKKHNRKIEALQERRFYPEELTEQDLRCGDTRRFLLDTGHGYLDEVLRVKNSYEGLI